jgi:integrase/recombinase XerD
LKGDFCVKKIEMQDTTQGITLDEGFDIFVRSCEVRNLRHATILRYENTMRSVYKFIEPKTLIKDITKDIVDGFVLHCRKDLNIKDITINTYLRGLKTILYYFMKMEYMKKFHIALIKYDKEIIETYSQAELEVLIKKPNTRKCHFSEFRNWTIINFLLGVGCRCSSLVNIRVADVDFTSEIVYLKTTKNRKPLVIPLSKTLIHVLKEYMKIRKGAE